MKKHLSATLAMMLSAASVYGNSTSEGQDFKFGVKGKPHFARMFGHDIYQPSAFKFSAGAFGEYAFSDMLGAQASLEYSGQGGAALLNRQVPDEFANLHHIMLALVPRLYVDEHRGLGLFLGPRVSWLAVAKMQKYERLDRIAFKGWEKVGEVIDLFEKGEKEGYQNIRNFNFGMLVGLDYEFDNGILLGADTNIGLTAVLKNKYGLLSNDVEMYTISYGVTVGYNFAKVF